MGRSKGPDKNRDAEGMLTREGIATNKATAAANKATANTNKSYAKTRDGIQQEALDIQKALQDFTVTRGVNPKTGIDYSRAGKVFSGPEKKQAVYSGDPVARNKLLDRGRQIGTLGFTDYDVPQGPNFKSVDAILKRGGMFPPTSIDTGVNATRQLATFDPNSIFSPGNYFGTRTNNPLNNLRAVQNYEALINEFDPLRKAQVGLDFDLAKRGQIGLLNMEDYQQEREKRADKLENDKLGIKSININPAYGNDFLTGYKPTDYMSDSLREALLPDQDRLFNDFLTDRTIDQFDINKSTLLPQEQRVNLMDDDTPFYKRIPNAAARLLGGMIGFNPVKSNTYFGELNPDNYYMGDMKNTENYNPMQYNNPIKKLASAVLPESTSNYLDFFNRFATEPVDKTEPTIDFDKKERRESRSFSPNNPVDPIITEDPMIGYGSIDPAANYNLLYGGGFANGGRVPPMSGPMSNGIGTLYKQK